MLEPKRLPMAQLPKLSAILAPGPVSAAVTLLCCWLLSFPFAGMESADFTLYYRSAVVFRWGGDPYLASNLAIPLPGVPEAQSWLPLLYHPALLPLFLPLALLPYQTAALLWGLVLSVVLAMFSALCVRMLRASHREAVVLSVLMFLALGGPASITLQTGNAAAFEVFACAAAMSSLVRNRFKTSLLLLAIASLLKGAPIILFALVLLRSPRRIALYAALAFVVAAFVLPLLFFPGVFASYGRSLTGAALRIDLFDYSLLTLLRPLGSFGPIVPPLFFGLVCGAVITLWRRYRPQPLPAYLMLYLLLTPRLKDYTLLLAIPVLAHAAQKFPLLLAAAIATTPLLRTVDVASGIQIVLVQGWLWYLFFVSLKQGPQDCQRPS